MWAKGQNKTSGSDNGGKWTWHVRSTRGDASCRAGLKLQDETLESPPTADGDNRVCLACERQLRRRAEIPLSAAIMKVRCRHSHYCYRVRLVVGNEYDVVEVVGSNYMIKDGMGEMTLWDKEWFDAPATVVDQQLTQEKED